jgi:hypothetical protein
LPLISREFDLDDLFCARNYYSVTKKDEEIEEELKTAAKREEALQN